MSEFILIKKRKSVFQCIRKRIILPKPSPAYIFVLPVFNTAEDKYAHLSAILSFIKDFVVLTKIRLPMIHQPLPRTDCSYLSAFFPPCSYMYAVTNRGSISVFFAESKISLAKTLLFSLISNHIFIVPDLPHSYIYIIRENLPMAVQCHN